MYKGMYGGKCHILASVSFVHIYGKDLEAVHLIRVYINVKCSVVFFFVFFVNVLIQTKLAE